MADPAAEAARSLAESTAMAKMQRDLAEAWALAEEDTGGETARRLLGTFARAAYGCGYVDALTPVAAA